MYPALTLIIGGERLGADQRPGADVLNPAHGRPLGPLPHATPADLDRALEAAEAAFGPWSRTAPIERARILKRAAALIRERVDAIARIMTLEQGKPLAEARGEVLYGAETIEWYAEEGRRAYGRIVPSAPGVRQMVVLEPVGVAAAFTPWNFPALTPCRKLGGALAAGCTLILKAAEDTPGTAVALVEAFHDAGAPDGVVNLVFGDPAEISSRLIASPIVRKVSFTGSVPVGKLIQKQAAEGMKRTTMELGGHGPVLVFDDADVDAVADMLAASKFRNAGQVCISPTRFYVQNGVRERFTQRFVAAAEALVVGDGGAAGVTFGPLASARRVSAMTAIVEDAQRRGARVLTGGAAGASEGFFYPPTVLVDVPDDALLMTEEPFGPVAPIVGFDTLEEVLERANSLPFGLAAYAFTTSNETAALVGAGLKAGMVGINTMGVSNPETPFGGFGESGIGQEGGQEGLMAYLNVKFIAHAAAVPAVR